MLPGRFWVFPGRFVGESASSSTPRAPAFALASLLAAFSSRAEMLIAARALLGIAGATIAPSTLSLIRNLFHDPRQFATAIGIWISAYSAGAAIGPLVGGV